MIRKLHSAVLLFTVLWSTLLLPQAAWAQTASLTCSNGRVDQGQLFFDDQGKPGSACEFIGSNGLQHVMSDIICQFVGMLNSVLGSVYCGMQDLLSKTVGAVLTVYVAVFGIQMLMGIADATAREFLVRMIKIAVVWIFVSQSAWGIQTVFNFFVSLSGEGVQWVMSSIPAPQPPSSTAGVDGFSVTFDCYDAQAAAATGFMAAFTRIDVIVCQALTGPLTVVNSKLIGFLVVLCLLVPQIGLLVLSWLWLNLKIIIQGLITFLLGISAIAFLIAMAPIFLSLMLFKATAGFFENWIKYMISFSLQVILVFACVALWLTVTLHFVDFFRNLSDTIFTKGEIIERSQATSAQDSWGVCPFIYYPDSSQAPPPTTPLLNPTYPPGPLVLCQPGFDTTNVDSSKLLTVTKLLYANGSGTGDSGDCQVQNSIPLANVQDCTKYIYYVVYHLIMLIIVTFGFEALLREAPMIATYLAGPDYTPPLGGSFSISRTGQIRSLFGSGGNKGGDGSSAPQRFFRDLFGRNDTPPTPPSRGGSGAPEATSAASATRAGDTASAPVASAGRNTTDYRQTAANMVTPRRSDDVT